MDIVLEKLSTGRYRVRDEVTQRIVGVVYRTRIPTFFPGEYTFVWKIAGDFRYKPHCWVRRKEAVEALLRLRSSKTSQHTMFGLGS